MKTFAQTHLFMRKTARPFLVVCALNVSLIVAAGQAETTQARLGKSTLHSFSVKSGEFAVSYDEASGLIAIRRPGKSLALGTHLAEGDLFRVTLPQFAQRFTVSKAGDVTRVLIAAERDWAKFRGAIEIYESTPGLMRFRLDVTTKRPTKIEDSAPEFSFVNAQSGAQMPEHSTVYDQQAGIEAPVVYLYNEELDAAILYLQNLTSLNQYINYVQGDPRYAVKLDDAGLGFRRPQGVVPGGVSFTINDSFLWLSPGRPADDIACAKQFMLAISQIYDRLDKPQTVYTDWPFEIAPQAAKDLLNPMNGVKVGDTRLLKAYVGERERKLESIVSLDVLIPAKKYARLFGADEHLSRLISDLEKGLPYWFVPIDGQKIFGNFSYPKREQDAWYFIYPLVQATELAHEGNIEAHRMMLASAGKLIEVGHAMDYEFSFMLDVASNRRANDLFREYDTLGGYAYVMLGCYEFTDEARYLEEAKRAVEHIRGKGFKFTYEPHFTALTLESLARLYQLTGDRHYIDLSYIPLANIFAMTWLWEPDYGYAASYSLFMGVNPVPSADQVAAFEIHNTWWYLSRFYLRAESALPEHVRKLVAEYLKYQLTVGHFTLPRFLPAEALSKTPDWGSVRRDMAIPIEDLKDGFHKSAMVGQEIYGCGEVFRFAADAYRVFGPSGELVLYTEYPVTASEWKASAATLEFTLGGVPAYASRVRVYFRGALSADAASAIVKRMNQPIQPEKSVPVTRGAGYIEFYAHGGSQYRVLLGQKPRSRSALTASVATRTAVPGVRVAAILGSAGVVQAKIGGLLSIPVAVTNPSSSPVSIFFEAGLPTGWRLETLGLNIAAGATEYHSLRVRLPQHLEAGALNQITIRMREAGRRAALLETVVRGVRDTDQAFREDFNGPASLFHPVDQNARLTTAEGIGAFTAVGDGVAGFETNTLTVDLDEQTYLDFNVRSLEGQLALKIYEVGSSPYGIYILPQIPIVPELPVTGLVRINLKERTGWSGIHSFKLGLYVVGRKGDTLRLDDWSLSDGKEQGKSTALLLTKDGGVRGETVSWR